LTPLAPKFPNFAVQILLFRLKHTVVVVTHAHVLQNFYTTWVRGVACQKQRLGPKLKGGLARGASKNLGPSTFSATVEASNFKFGTQIGVETSLPKNNFWTKIGGGSGLGEHPKKLGPLRIFATVEASSLEFGTQLAFGTSLPKNNVLDQNWRGSGQGSIQKSWDPYLFLQPLKLATEKSVHNMSSGLPCQTQVLRPN